MSVTEKDNLDEEEARQEFRVLFAKFLDTIETISNAAIDNNFVGEDPFDHLRICVETYVTAAHMVSKDKSHLN